VASFLNQQPINLKKVLLFAQKNCLLMLENTIFDHLLLQSLDINHFLSKAGDKFFFPKKKDRSEKLI
jgi:hypothetical protein